MDATARRTASSHQYECRKLCLLYRGCWNIRAGEVFWHMFLSANEPPSCSSNPLMT